MNIRLNVRNIDRWIAFLKDVPRGAKGIATRAFATYVLGGEGHGLRHAPAYKYVSRKRAYGYTFKSAKQRRWFWANGGPGMIGNNRTGKLQNGWAITGSAETRLFIVNRVPYAGWVMGDAQARQPNLVGWRQAWDIVMSNFAGGIRAAQAAVMAWINSKG